MQLPYVEKTTKTKPSPMAIPHMHPFYEIYFLTEGEREVYIENDIFPIKKNTLVCIPPQNLHRMEGGAYTRFLVNFSADDLSESEMAIISLFERHIIPLSTQETEHILSIINTFQRAQDNNDKEFLAEKQATVNACLHYLIVVLSQLTNFPTSKYASPNDYSLRVRELLAYVHEHYAEKISLSSLAQMFYVSKPTLCNEFKKCTHMSILDYVLTFRLTQVQRLLVCSQRKNLDEIARMCGLTSANYMSLIFKRKIGISPNEYRKRNKNRIPKNV